MCWCRLKVACFSFCLIIFCLSSYLLEHNLWGLCWGLFSQKGLYLCLFGTGSLPNLDNFNLSAWGFFYMWVVWIQTPDLSKNRSRLWILKEYYFIYIYIKYIKSPQRRLSLVRRLYFFSSVCPFIEDIALHGGLGFSSSTLIKSRPSLPFPFHNQAT